MKSFFKDLFRIPERERNGITAFTLIILGSMALLSFKDAFLNPPEPIPHEQLQEFEEWKLSEVELRNNEDLSQSSYSFSDKKSFSRKKNQGDFRMDPNQANFKELIEAGFTKELAGRLIAWRKSGKVFHFKQDVAKLKGLSDSLFERIAPGIALPDSPVLNEEKKVISEVKKVDINAADTSEWIALPGIGPAFAKRIVAYRERLGGFHSAVQLLEVYGITDEKWNAIKDKLEVKTLLSPTDLNTCTLDQLLRFPYLKPVVARGIINYREKHGSYKRIEDLLNTDLVDAELYAKIAPYFFVK